MNETFLTSFDDSKRALAKLMARENITVQVVDGITTADFNTVSRILRIPNWPSLTADQTDLLIGHEVGHALYTDFSYIEKLVAKKRAGQPIKGLMTYFNVIEDTRIERKMRTAFPGLRRSFYRGYQEFMALGPIFKMNGSNFVHPVTGTEMPVASMGLIDRINVHYKVGVFVSVPFTAAEKLWLAKIDACNTQNDALAIAEAMYQEAKDKSQTNQDNEQKQGEGEGEGAEGDDSKHSDKKSKSEKQSKKSEADAGEQSDDASDDDAASSEGDSEGGENGSDSDDASDAGDSTDGEQDGGVDDDAADESGEEGAEGAAEGTGAEGDDADGSDDATDDGDDLHDLLTKPAQGKHVPNMAKGTKETDAYADPQSFTDDANQAGLAADAETADKVPQNQKVVHLLIKPLDSKTVADRTVSAKDWADAVCDIIDAKSGGVPGATAYFAQAEATWNESFLGTAKHMAIEFGRRKSAKALSNVKIGKTGKINPGKLHAYKFSDDLFLRSMTVPNGQSHGIVMVIDMSGSMEGVFGDVLDQVLLFANFTKAANIPFEAYGFTTSGKLDSYGGNTRVGMTSTGPNTVTLPSSGRLIGLVDTTATNFKKQLKALHAWRVRWALGAGSQAEQDARTIAYSFPYTRLGSTPLYCGMMIAERHLERMKRVQKLDKVMNVVITDGEDSENLMYESSEINRDGTIRQDFSVCGSTAIVVRDTVTKKNHVLVESYTDTYSKKDYLYCPTNGLLSLMMDVNKERHDARNIMIFLVSGSKKSVSSYIINKADYFMKPGTKKRAETNQAFLGTLGITSESIAKSISDDSQYALPKTLGVADLVVIIPTTTTRLSDRDFTNTDMSKFSQRKIAAAFVKSLTLAKTNRVFVNTVIPFLV